LWSLGVMPFEFPQPVYITKHPNLWTNVCWKTASP